MTALRLGMLLLGAAIALPLTAGAVQPDEILPDPEQEARAREISREVRCLVCRNESIDDSSAELARDLRLLVREQVAEGKTNAEVKSYLVDRYGEFVLLKPQFTLENALIWASGPILFVVGAIAAGIFLRQRRPAGPSPETPTDAPLTAEERARLARILTEDRET
ncbi:MAG: cytochrome c-type biogenesis protein [Paracoccaceae bacterium]